MGDPSEAGTSQRVGTTPSTRLGSGLVGYSKWH